jgi:hypothetical protein
MQISATANSSANGNNVILDGDFVLSSCLSDVICETYASLLDVSFMVEIMEYDCVLPHGP